MLAAMDEGADLSSLRLAVSAGETLPAPVFNDWMRRTGKPILDGIGATEMLHIFISNRLDDLAPGSTGKPVRGYEARIVDEDMNEAAARHGRPARRARPDRLPLPRRPAPAHLCARRLEPHRRFLRAGRGGLLPFRRAFGRHDHLGRLQHRRAGSGGGAADASRRARMRRDRHTRRRARPDRRRRMSCWPTASRRMRETAKRLQDHVKATIAPFKYPRSVKFTTALPKTQTGKIQRFQLRNQGQS